MGLFDKFKKAVSAEPAAPATPAAITAQASDFPDPVFSTEVLGKGCAIWPENDVVYAPVSGEVTVTMGHAVGLKSDSGVEVLVHVGVDTVDMKGRGFTGYVKQGDHVSAGDPMIKIDRSEIAAAGHPDCVVLAVSNTAEYASVTMTAEADVHVDAGAAVVEVAK